MKELTIDGPIVLIGFMAVGKTAVGKLLAKNLRWSYIDTDAVISARARKSIEQIFVEDGEAYFRNLENELLSELMGQQQTVISTGGGLPCSSRNSDLISKHSHSVHISLGVDRIYERLLMDTKRPLVKGKSSAELRKFIKVKLRERIPYYNKAKVHVMGHNSPKQIADRIITKLKRSR